MPTMKFWIKGLAHEDEARVAEHIRRLDGVFYVVANHREQCAEIDFEDDRVTCEQIQNAVATLGYTAQLAG
jgi:copper chaperone CopZ